MEKGKSRERGRGKEGKGRVGMGREEIGERVLHPTFFVQGAAK